MSYPACMTDPIAERKMPPGRVHTVRDALYFWAPSKLLNTVRIGMQVPKYSGVWRFAQRSDLGVRVEDLVEAVRPPNLPSRIGNVFLCPDEGGFCGRRVAERGAGEVYAVNVTGRVFHTNARTFTRVAELLQDADRAARRLDGVDKSLKHLPDDPSLLKDRAWWMSETMKKTKYAQEEAESYWRGELGMGYEIEVIAEGKVTVLGPVTDVRAESRRRPQGVLIERNRR